MTNPILDQLHATRQQLLEAAGGTLEGLVTAIQKRQKQSGRQIINGQQAESDARAAKKAEHDKKMIKKDADWDGDDFVDQTDALARG